MTPLLWTKLRNAITARQAAFARESMESGLELQRSSVIYQEHTKILQLMDGLANEAKTNDDEQ